MLDNLITEWITTASVGIGDTILANAPPDNTSLVVAGYHILNATSTANFYEVGFREGMAGIVHFRSQSSTGQDEMAREFNIPGWMLGTQTSLVFNVIQHGMRQSTPTFFVTVHGFIRRR